MSIRFGLARAVSALSTWGLKHVFRRPAANFPGKIALYVDPNLVTDLRSRVSSSVCVVGTNGKTTVANLLADTFEAAGFHVVCNRTGANLDSGVATALLHSRNANWGVFECDELWLAKILPHLKSDYVLLLNLFRDQLDRIGEIDHIQESVANALMGSPNTVLVYNADDPLCQAIADKVPNKSVPFGLADDLGLPQNTVADARMCQRCSSMLDYAWRQYGQLGNYTCPHCGFSRSDPTYTARNVEISEHGSSFAFESRQNMDSRPSLSPHIKTSLSGAYMVYNLLAVSALSDLAGVPLATVQQAVTNFNPRNGRLQAYEINGRHVLLNLAKNPTGFNQNLKIVLQGSGPKAVAFYINDKEADGHDVSWLWDIDFQELVAAENIAVFAGGIRRNDMQVRLKYAGVNADLVEGADDFLKKAEAALPEAKTYIIANYTALPGVKSCLDRLEARSDAKADAGDLEDEGENHRDTPTETHPRNPTNNSPKPTVSAVNSRNDDKPQNERLVIAHMFPTLLNLYGDGGNVTVLADRARKRGIIVDVVQINHGDSIDFSSIDIVFLGGGPDREQHLASDDLLTMADELRKYVDSEGVLLAICGGYQILGREWLLGNETVPGLGLLDLTTKRVEGGSHNRLVDNIVLTSDLASSPIVGYENHAGRTFLGKGTRPFGQVVGTHGKGNNDSGKADGAIYRNVIGTYLHGPLLAKNPEVADEILRRALDRRAALESRDAFQLTNLDDSVELEANRFMCERLGVKRADTERNIGKD